VSEYQYYEFLAVDRPLSAEQQAAVRRSSTRARITATSFVNEYHWGDFKGSPDELVRRYYDLHLYYANWGARRLMLRLPAVALSGIDLDRYVLGDYMDARRSGKNLILDVSSDAEDEDWDEEWTLGAFTAVRAELLDGDLRSLYLIFLAAIGVWAYDEDAFDYADGDVLEPPVPAGLGELTGAQRTLVDFLRLDADLLAEAASASRSRNDAGHPDLRDWVTNLPIKDKDEALLRLLEGDHAAARAGLLRRRQTAKSEGVAARARTIGQLLDDAAKRKQVREEHVTAERAHARVELERLEAERRGAHLARLAAAPDNSWLRADSLIRGKTQEAYDRAVALLCDLREIAESSGSRATFDERLAVLYSDHRNKPTLVRRLEAEGMIRR
jgi:hypothetical protein